MNELFRAIDTLPGVAEKRAEKYRKLGIETPMDLLYHFPRTYLDFTTPTTLAEAEHGVPCAIRCTIVEKLRVIRLRTGLSLYKALATDGTGDCILTFYNTPYTYDALRVGGAYYAYGKLTGGLTQVEMVSPHIQAVEQAMLLLPIYPQTVGLTSVMMRTNVQRALTFLDDAPMETLPAAVREQHQLCTLSDALRGIHRPANHAILDAARRRLAFEELLQFQLGTQMLRNRSRAQTAIAMQADVSLQDFYDALPFTMTEAQMTAVQEILAELCANRPMNRLLQGDVGSGKTVVAAAACAFAAKNGVQSVLMAPTEILAQQHFETLTAFLEPIGFAPVLLTGSVRAKEKRALKARIADGSAMVVVGTHAVLQSDTVFLRLGLVITDEQHRFGVAQRAALAEKGGAPHKLVMSATPIPRTLALIIYGDLDVSVLREMPKGRLPIQTFAVTGGLRARAYHFVQERLEQGEQAYLVCAMIEESEQMENVQAAQSYAETLKNGAFSAYRIGLLHGKMKGAEKERVMADMKAHRLDLLVCTTVVEVGVDVPNATVIVIENADRFGLAQLHQLRGRVGRSTKQSYCILVTDSKKEESRARLKVLSRTTDGAVIAEEDLQLRGPGDFFGNAQHGIPPMLQTALVGDMALVSETQTTAKELLTADAELRLPEHSALRLAVLQLFTKHGENGLN